MEPASAEPASAELASAEPLSATELGHWWGRCFDCDDGGDRDCNNRRLHTRGIKFPSSRP